MAVIRPVYCVLSGCGPMVAQHELGEGVPYGARGCCRRCYNNARAQGIHLDLPRLNRANADVIEDWEELRAQRCTRVTAAERMGMTFAALDRAIYRHRKRTNEQKKDQIDA